MGVPVGVPVTTSVCVTFSRGCMLYPERTGMLSLYSVERNTSRTGATVRVLVRESRLVLVYANGVSRRV